MDIVVRWYDHSGHWWQSHCDLDRISAQTDAHRHQLLLGKLEHRGCYGVHAERHVQLYLHVEQSLALWHALLQDMPIRRSADYMCQCLHSHGDFH